MFGPCFNRGKHVTQLLGYIFYDIIYLHIYIYYLILYNLLLKICNVLYSVSLTAHIHAPGTAAEGGRGDAAEASAGDGGETACGAATRQTGRRNGTGRDAGKQKLGQPWMGGLVLYYTLILLAINGDAH